MPNGEICFSTNNGSVRARGNSTFAKPKKPFAIKLNSQTSLLGMRESKQWILLANFMDHSLLRNSLALEISKQTSMDYTTNYKFVDVVVNDSVMGCYLLCEAIRVGKDCVEVAEDNGYLIEFDSYPQEKNQFTTKIRGLKANIKYPKSPSYQQFQAITESINSIEEAIYSDSIPLSSLYGTRIDLDSFVDWWIIYELTQNAEPNGPRSCYMHLGKDGLLKAGPMWDFDLAFITVGLDAGGDIRPARLNRKDVVTLNGDSIYNANALWYPRLLADPVFNTQLKQRWAELMPKFKSLIATLKQWKQLIAPSAIQDQQMWGHKDPARFDNFTDWQSSVDNLIKAYTYRIESLNRYFSNE